MRHLFTSVSVERNKICIVVAGVRMTQSKVKYTFWTNVSTSTCLKECLGLDQLSLQTSLYRYQRYLENKRAVN